MKKTSKKFIIFGLLCLFFATNSIGSSPSLGRYNTADPKNYQLAKGGGKVNAIQAAAVFVAAVAGTYIAVYEAGKVLGMVAYYYFNGSQAKNDLQNIEIAYYNPTDFSSFDAKN